MTYSSPTIQWIFENTNATTISGDPNQLVVVGRPGETAQGLIDVAERTSDLAARSALLAASRTVDAMELLHRRQLTRAWAAYLESLLAERLSDGTPVLELVFALDSDLRERLGEVLKGARRA